MGTFDVGRLLVVEQLPRWARVGIFAKQASIRIDQGHGKVRSEGECF